MPVNKTLIRETPGGINELTATKALLSALQRDVARSPMLSSMGRNLPQHSTPSLPLLSSLDCFVHLCYPVPVGLGTLVRQRETVRLRVPSQLNVGRSEREPTLR